MLPVFTAIRKAAETKDVNFYPQLEELLLRVMTEEQFEQLVSGLVPVEEVLSQVARWGGSFFTSATAKEYMNSFLQTLREKKAEEFTGSCPKCQQELIFETAQEFHENPNCPDCSGPLEMGPLKEVSDPAEV